MGVLFIYSYINKNPFPYFSWLKSLVLTYNQPFRFQTNLHGHGLNISEVLHCPELHWYYCYIPVFTRFKFSKVIITCTTKDFWLVMNQCHFSTDAWQKIQKYPLPYHQTTEQLLSQGHETPQFILRTLLHKIVLAFVCYMWNAPLILFLPNWHCRTQDGSFFYSKLIQEKHILSFILLSTFSLSELPNLSGQRFGYVMLVVDIVASSVSLKWRWGSGWGVLVGSFLSNSFLEF